MRRALKVVSDGVAVALYGAGLWWVARQVPWWGAALIAPALVFLYYFGKGVRQEWQKLHASRRDPVQQLAHTVVLVALRGRRL